MVDRFASSEVVESVVRALDDELCSTDVVELVDCVSVEVTPSVEPVDVTPDLLVVEDCGTSSVCVVLPEL